MESVFVSVVPHLNSEKGHLQSYHQSLKNPLEKKGIEHLVYLSKTATFSLPIGWFPYFHSRGRSPLKYGWNRFLEFSKLFLNKKQSCLYFLESFGTLDFFAFSLAAKLFLSKKNRLALLFRYDLPFGRPSGKVQSLLFKCLKRKFKKNLLGFTDTELLRTWFLQKNIDLRVVPIPIGSSFINLNFEASSPNSEEFVSQTLGFSIEENGQRPFTRWKILGKASKLPENEEVKCKATQRSLEKICWWPGEPRMQKGREEIKKLLELKDPSIDFFWLVTSCAVPFPDTPRLLKIKDILTPIEYQEQFFRSDIILLPYDPCIYKRGSSSIFVETVIYGKMPLVKQGSWLSYELERFNLFELIINWSCSDFFSHLKQLTENIKVLEKLKQMQEAYKEYHTPSNLVSKVLSHYSVEI
ncbi:MAG: hypothetical protein KDK55_01580 [Chlamydiia bacterium]|nr:hypothetical protein [Chlamydiia bacterium]